MSANEPGSAANPHNRPQSDSAIAERIIRRDRWMLRTLAALTLSFWILSAGIVLSMYGIVLVWVMPKIAEASDMPPGADSRPTWEAIWTFIVRVGWPMSIASAVLVLLAALCTVMLVYWSRQATLRLVDRRLAQILEHLRTNESGAQSGIPR